MGNLQTLGEKNVRSGISWVIKFLIVFDLLLIVLIIISLSILSGVSEMKQEQKKFFSSIEEKFIATAKE